MSIRNNTDSLINLPQNKQGKVSQFFNDWENEFVERIKKETKSQKQLFGLKDAIQKSIKNRTPMDELIIEYHQFTSSNTLENNHYYKYLSSYKKDKKLQDKFFKYDLKDLYKYYKKIDKDPKYFPFSKSNWKSYVLFMLLKLKGLYEPEKMDDIFNVIVKDNREYNPLTNIVKPLRGLLPKSLNLLQYDISRAYPTFIDIELGIDQDRDVYKIIDKKGFHTLINTHKDIEDADLDKIREALKPVYGDKVEKVLTEERFNEKGKMFKDFARYEQQYIEKFIEENEITNYVRLHDAILVSSDVQIKIQNFGKVKFKASSIELPPILNDKKLFYKVVKGGKVITNPVMYKTFFQQENIIRVTERQNDKIIVFKDTNNVIIPFNHKTNMASYLASNINEYDTEAVENKIAKDASRTVIDGLRLLPAKELEYYRDPKDNFGLPFKNGFCRFNTEKTDIEILPYKQVEGFFPEHDIQKVVFKPKLENRNKFSDFERFLTMVSVAKDPKFDELTANDVDTVNSFKSMFGYLCHSFKNPSFAIAVILSDHDADGENRNGGRGKTIFGKSIAKVQKQMLKGGNEFRPDYNHNFADLDRSYPVYFIDDVPAKFKYDALYTNIVSDISPNPKGTIGDIIPFEFAPKFVISTNWTVMFDKNAYSTNRRFMEFKFTKYFSKDRLPTEVFGHNLFDDWNADGWNDFYNFVFHCVQLYLKHGLKAPDYDKELDNYRALFYNESVEDEFIRIFDELKDKPDGFAVNDFLKSYNDYTNSLRHEKYFHRNNVKKMVNAYVYHHKIDLKYIERDKRWVSEFTEDDDTKHILGF